MDEGNICRRLLIGIAMGMGAMAMGVGRKWIRREARDLGS